LSPYVVVISDADVSRRQTDTVKTSERQNGKRNTIRKLFPQYIFGSFKTD